MPRFMRPANCKAEEGLEGLAGKIPGLVEVHVNINGLPSSTADLMLDTTFESAEALKGCLLYTSRCV